MSATVTPLAPEAEDVREQADSTSCERWSVRRVVAFVIILCSAFWLSLGAIVLGLVRALS